MAIVADNGNIQWKVFALREIGLAFGIGFIEVKSVF